MKALTGLVCGTLASLFGAPAMGQVEIASGTDLSIFGEESERISIDITGLTGSYTG